MRERHPFLWGSPCAIVPGQPEVGAVRAAYRNEPVINPDFEAFCRGALRMRRGPGPGVRHPGDQSTGGKLQSLMYRSVYVSIWREFVFP